MRIGGVEKLIILSQPFWFFLLHPHENQLTRKDLQLPLQQMGVAKVYLLVLSSSMVNIAEKPICRYGVVDTFVPCHLLKFGFSEKATKFEKNLRCTFDKSVVFCAHNIVLVKKLTKIFQNKCGQVVLY